MIYSNFSIVLLLLFLFEKYQYSVQWAFKSAICLGMDLNSFFLDAINREAIKVESTPTIKTAFLVMALRQKLPRPFKSYISHRGVGTKLEVVRQI